ncbi:restriction endonuclease subunit S [Ferroacidibacillus organovorans]|uniref:Type I restriction modification DNA specificity domain-containing protein n=1 Tax=Ferroacidibacillus organovorans TaxID=1765683 RepID=A0A124IWF9_9BACL|nr:restriction endonuclease subunit S [Ferroacidibacillus organovorans]KUO97291.1 hypothetical protein ATW55_11920 [Ferroacidibacillus organovorans]
MNAVDGWISDGLGKVASVTMGQSPDSKFYSEEPTGLPFLQGCSEFRARTPNPVLYCSQVKKVAEAGSILFSVRAPVGKINIANKEYIIGRGLAAILATGIDPGYLEHFLTYCEPKFRNASQGSTFEAINSVELNNWKLRFPISRSEQTKIAEILSTVDRAIEQTEALIAKQQRIKTGLMHDLLTRGIDEQGNLRSEETHQFKDSPLGRIPVEWNAEPLSSIVDLQVGYAFKSSWFSEDGIRLLRGENVGNGRSDWKDRKYLPDSIASKFLDYELAAGDLIIGMDRTFTKQGFKVSLLREEDIPSLLVQRVGRFRPLSVSVGFMRLLIQSPAYRRELLLQQKGMDIPHLSKSEILSPIVPIPQSINEMNEISSRMQTFERAEQGNSDQLQKLYSLKTALMQDLMTGKKRVTALLNETEVMNG